MSERYGRCKSCLGTGFVHREDGDVEKNKIVGVGANGKIIYAVECGLCGGTGHSGDVDDYRAKEDRWEHEQEINEIFEVR